MQDMQKFQAEEEEKFRARTEELKGFLERHGIMEADVGMA